MKLLYVSGLYAKDQEESLRLKCKGGIGVQNAANAFQWAIVEGLENNTVDYQLLSYPLLPVFPVRYKSLFTRNAPIMMNGRVIGRMRKYCTMIGIKPYSIIRRLRKDVEVWCDSCDTNEKKTILIYSTYTFYLKAILPLKSKYKNLKIAVIITDLIDDALNYSQNQTILKKIQVRNDTIYIKESYSQIDKFILLTRAMVEKIPEAESNHIVIEGVSSSSKTFTPKQEPTIRTILYTGTLQKYVGIDDFVDAFHKVENCNLNLIICGAGSSASYIQAMAEIDSRIIYKGLVTREEALNLQRNATYLVNPRKPTEDITRFSFPSKTIEYMTSGTPMIGYKLEGIPSEYYDYIFTPDDNEGESMTKLINDLAHLSIEELNVRAAQALDFINKNKTAKMQVSKIINYISQ